MINTNEMISTKWSIGAACAVLTSWGVFAPASAQAQHHGYGHPVVSYVQYQHPVAVVRPVPVYVPQPVYVQRPVYVETPVYVTRPHRSRSFNLSLNLGGHGYRAYDGGRHGYRRSQGHRSRRSYDRGHGRSGRDHGSRRRHSRSSRRRHR
ncbi:MAG: hypothetical protein GXP29_05500 [Planctomycetes bacterium]|nr:hypothetical protein [Planctomycetota bacterium]